MNNVNCVKRFTQRISKKFTCRQVRGGAGFQGKAVPGGRGSPGARGGQSEQINSLEGAIFWLWPPQTE
jgi:hypothetical protein